MNKLFPLIVLVFLVVACKKNSPAVIPPVTEPEFLDKNWSRIRIPDGGEVFAVAGNLDDTLLVTTLYNTYMVTDNGLTFTKSKEIIPTVPGLLTVQDTIFALTGNYYDAKFEKNYSGGSSYYTLDMGLSWNSSDSKDAGKVMRKGIVTTANNVTYQLTYRTGPDKNGKGTNWVLPTEIIKIDSLGNGAAFAHPVKNEQPLNLYLDKKGRLYIPTGGSFSNTGVYIGPSALKPAYIYISKEAV